jgi:hypothetical protein
MNTLDPFDPSNLRLSGDLFLTPQPSSKPPRHRPGEKFLKGPIPWPWLIRASRLPGKTLLVALLIWHKAGWRKSRTIRVCLKAAVDLEISRRTVQRAIHALEAAKLVTTHSAPGQCLRVTILEASRG